MALGRRLLKQLKCRFVVLPDTAPVMIVKAQFKLGITVALPGCFFKPAGRLFIIRLGDIIAINIAQLLELAPKARKLMDLPVQRLTDIMTIRNREKGKCH